MAGGASGPNTFVPPKIIVLSPQSQFININAGHANSVLNVDVVLTFEDPDLVPSQVMPISSFLWPENQLFQKI